MLLGGLGRGRYDIDGLAGAQCVGVVDTGVRAEDIRIEAAVEAADPEPGGRCGGGTDRREVVWACDSQCWRCDECFHRSYGRASSRSIMLRVRAAAPAIRAGLPTAGACLERSGGMVVVPAQIEFVPKNKSSADGLNMF